MAKSTLLIRQSLIHQTSRRHLSVSSPRRTSTSPQRRAPATPALAADPRPFGDIPGPIGLPMMGHSAHVLPRIGSFHHTVGLGLLERLREKYGELVRLAKMSRRRPVLYVFDPELMRQVYESHATESPHFEKSPLNQHRKAVGCPAHGDESKAIWVGIRTLLMDKTLLSSYDKAFDDIASDTTRRLGDLRHAENALNDELETEVYRWAVETIGMMIFGIRLGCLDGKVHVPTMDNKNPEKSVDDSTIDPCSLTRRSIEELTPAERLVRTCRSIADENYLIRSEGTLKTDSATFNGALKAFDRHFSLTEHFVTQALHTLNSKEPRPEQMLLDKLRPLGGRILPLAADVLLAGVDPLAQTALNMFYHLSLNAARQQRVHDEVSWSTASREAGAGSPALPYITGCVREAMRLYPATGGVVRRTNEAIVVGGYEIPAGVDIVLAHGVTSKSEKQWGRAKDFIPERWCKGSEPLQASRAHPYSSVPFGENCPGAGITGKMLGSLVYRVLDKYRLEWHGPPPNSTTAGVNRIEPPYYFVLQNAA